MDALLSHVAARQREIVSLIRQFAECESPSDDPAAVNRFVELVFDTVAPMARVKTCHGGRRGKHLLCEMKLPGRKKSGQILALGHSDTVWPLCSSRFPVGSSHRSSCGRCTSARARAVRCCSPVLNSAGT